MRCTYEKVAFNIVLPVLAKFVTESLEQIHDQDIEINKTTPLK